MMRKPDRLLVFYTELAEVHAKTIPDWRVGQFWSNFFRWLYNERIDPFFPEEGELLRLIKEFLNVENNWEIKTIS